MVSLLTELQQRSIAAYNVNKSDSWIEVMNLSGFYLVYAYGL